MERYSSIEYGIAAVTEAVVDNLFLLDEAVRAAAGR